MPAKTGPKQGGRFQPGRSGNPRGKPKGARHLATRAAEALLDGEAEKLTRKAIERALDGDGVALRLCLERILPPRRDRAAPFAVPKIESADDAAKAMAAIIAAVAAGELSPSEGDDIAALVETYRKALETSELEARIRALEERGRDEQIEATRRKT